MTKALYRMIAGSDKQANTCSGPSTESDALIINEAQLILAEKRTSLAAMRTGIAVFALPLSVLGLLIATSRYYDCAACTAADRTVGRHAPGIDHPGQLSDLPGVE
jgi:hypothetical protein